MSSSKRSRSSILLPTTASSSSSSSSSSAPPLASSTKTSLSASSSSSSASSSSLSFHTVTVRHVQCWTCDVCLVASFPTLEEATHHEDLCRRRQQQQQKQKRRREEESNDTSSEAPHAAEQEDPEREGTGKDDVVVLVNASKHSSIATATSTTTKQKNSVMDLMKMGRPPAANARNKKKAATEAASAAATRTATSSSTSPSSVGSNAASHRPSASTWLSTASSRRKKQGPSAATMTTTTTSTTTGGGGDVRTGGGGSSSKGGTRRTKSSSSSAPTTSTATTATSEKDTRTTKSRKKKKDDEAENSDASLLIQQQEKLLREQHVLNEFRAKRKAKEDLWNQQKAKQQQLQQQQQLSGATAAVPALASSSSTQLPSSASAATTATAAVRFPNPSHVLGDVESVNPSSVSRSGTRRSSSNNDDPPAVAPAPSLLRTTTTRGNNGNPPPAASPTPRNRVTWPSSLASSVLSPHNNDDPVIYNASLLQHLLANTWKQPPRSAGNDGAASQPLLWADAYSFRSVETLPEYREALEVNAPDDGRSFSRRTSRCPRRQLEEFVRDWMVQRHESHRLMTERQERLRLKWSSSSAPSAKKTKKSKKRNNDDDDGWLGATHDDDGDGSGALPAVCLLVGPVGAGKTSLVRSVVESSPDCRGCRVLEISTVDKRGSASLKKVVEEATRSYSSRELFQRKDSARHASYGGDLQPPHSRRREAIEDSEGDEEDYPISEDDELSSKSRDGSALTAVLVDEVDLLYEEDAGFWNTMNELSKRSKSPLILTANAVPAGIATCRDYRIIPVDRPSVEECVAWLSCVSTNERFHCTISDPLERAQALSKIVDACGRDLRRLAHELQLFSHGSNAAADHGELAVAGPSRRCTGSVDEPAAGSQYRRVMISRVEPESVRAESYTLLTIHGSGFTTLVSAGSNCDLADGCPVLVRVGTQPCPCARIVSDSVILAVKSPCPPLSKKEQTPFCTFQNVYRAWNAEWKEVTVSSVKPSGLISTTEGALLEFDAATGSCGVARAPVCLLQCNFSTLSVKVSTSPDDIESDSEPEMELDVRDRTSDISNLPTLLPHPTGRIDWTVVEEIFESGLSNWKGENASTEPYALGASTAQRSDVASVELLAHTAALASDGALIQEVGCHGLPWITGACKGFAGDLTTRSGPSNDRSKRPSEDRLFACGWKDDCYFYGDANAYMTRPLAHEMNWLRRTESSGRGAVPWNSDATNPDLEDVAEDSIPGATADSEEDSMLPRSVPSCITAWAASLIRLAAPDLEGVRASDSSRLVLCTLERVQSHLELLRVLLREFYQVQLFAGGLSSRTYDRTAGSLLPLEMVDSRLFLDYLPLLRVMATVDEEVRAAALLATCPSDPPLPSRKRRQTRNSAQRMENRHFLSDLVPLSQFDEDRDDSVPDIVKRLTMYALHRRIPAGLQIELTANATRPC